MNIITQKSYYRFCIRIVFDKGNNASVNGSILTKLITNRESMVLIIYTNKNASNLTNRS